jgi:hypothetical protein
MMSERIRWERIDGTVTSWFGYVGTIPAPLFQILHPLDTKPDARQFHKWALAATFAQDEVRYPETAEGAQAALKDEAEDWLEEFVAFLGAVFPEAGFEFEDDGEPLEVKYAAGRRVRYVHPDYGYPGEQEPAAELLILGAAYTIAACQVGQSRTDLILEGIPGEWFNSVFFEPVDEVAAAAAAAREKE